MQLDHSFSTEILGSFRRESGRLLATLTRAFGPDKLQLAEDVVQETFVRAMRQWSMRGIPPNPGAWLGRVAQNLAVDRVRREHIYASSEALETLAAPAAREVLMDDELRMLFLGCHPILPEKSRIALVLKACCGLSTSEIARGLLAGEVAVAQRLVRAKSLLRTSGVSFDMPEGDELSQRLGTVLRVLYLLFNEGYLAHAGNDLIDSDLCDEAILLTSRLVNVELANNPQTHALLAVMLLHSSRLPARVDVDGALCLLEHQDRKLWDRSRIGAGLHHLALASTGPELSPYHCEAAIAAEHCTSAEFDTTNWVAILEHYDDLIRLAPSPIGRLNRAIAVRMVKGAARGLQALDELANEPKLRTYYLLPATRARFLIDMGREEEARGEYMSALALATNDAETRFLKGVSTDL